MSRRKTAEDIEFGSDSFLDVVANIVGILIILIVVAGIKAGQSAVSPEKVAEFIQKKSAQLQPSVAAPPATHEPAMIPVSPDLSRRVDALKAQTAALANQSEAFVAQVARTAEDEQRAKVQAADLNRALETETAELSSRERRLAEAQGRLEREKTGLLQLEVDVKKATAEKPAAKPIKHQLTPLSREIQGKELHFRLLNNRVAYLPIPELMNRLRPEIMHQRDRIIRRGIHRGEIGPVAGFRMSYLIEIRRMSVVDELRRGAAMTVGVSDWKLEAEPDLDTESADEALKPGSDFLRYVRTADPDSTLTLWVYPDSFAIYQRLQQFAQNENFTVAARPLPFDVPIAGSPHGSRSSGQ
jgi:hypothetical protein